MLQLRIVVELRLLHVTYDQLLDLSLLSLLTVHNFLVDDPCLLLGGLGDIESQCALLFDLLLLAFEFSVHLPLHQFRGLSELSVLRIHFFGAADHDHQGCVLSSHAVHLRGMLLPAVMCWCHQMLSSFIFQTPPACGGGTILLGKLSWWKLFLRIVILEVHWRRVPISGGRAIWSLGCLGPPCLVNLLKSQPLDSLSHLK